MNVPRTIFRQYDVRGLVDEELTPEFACALGRAMASLGWTKLGRAPVIAVGRDNRPSGLRLSEGFRRGIMQAGGTAVAESATFHDGWMVQRVLDAVRRGGATRLD